MLLEISSLRSDAFSQSVLETIEGMGKLGCWDLADGVIHSLVEIRDCLEASSLHCGLDPIEKPIIHWIKIR